MSAHKSHILITTAFEDECEKYSKLLQPSRVVRFIVDDFKIEDAKAVIKEAYISDAHIKYIILAAQSFNHPSQNALLKVLEEPPPNIRFIIISPSKSNLLPTIRSRLPLVKGSVENNKVAIDLTLSRINYGEVFAFLKENARIKKDEAKLLVSAIYRQATEVDKLILTSVQLENFEKAYKLLELNSRPQNVLAMLVMSFVGDR